ncbi:hypothetical protein FB465_0249 [Kitasatospora atroaurantiaca]|uniref:Uncharacterized protein n=1 Tax=Kitasatospora atroaurantiaca TaxID=285545 RepID=A0A561EIB6_9ACTN|nr:hypothetical protein FB465_0249 [Kitasatospora atroaurantiaca]
MVVAVQAECLSEQPYRLAVRSGDPSAFQIPERPHTQARAFRELLLCQSRLDPPGTQHLAELSPVHMPPSVTSLCILGEYTT